MRGTSATDTGFNTARRDFYPRSPCGERPRARAVRAVVDSISIHVPLAGNVVVTARVYRRAVLFLSTFPLRGTSSVSTPRSESRWISIHVPLAGNVPAYVSHIGASLPFLSTFPLRGTSRGFRSQLRLFAISIHVPLAGNVRYWRYMPSAPRQFLSTFPLRGTSQAAIFRLRMVQHFYPRSPCGERPVWDMGCAARVYFYPRSPCGERPRARAVRAVVDSISIHVPLAGNVPPPPSPRSRPKTNFYPRSPCGERPPGHSQNLWPAPHFYPRSPCGERLLSVRSIPSRVIFLSTFPLRGTSANCDRLLPLVCKSIGNSKHSVLAAWLTRGVITPDSLSGIGAKISGGF